VRIKILGYALSGEEIVVEGNEVNSQDPASVTQSYFETRQFLELGNSATEEPGPPVETSEEPKPKRSYKKKTTS